MKPLIALLVLLSLFACGKEKTSKTKAQTIVDKAIATHGGEKYANAIIEFDFRNRRYKNHRKNGFFQYERIFQDSSNNTIHDILANNGFRRTVNDTAIELSEKDKARYANSVNSVHYFLLLPYPLNDPAVNKKYLGEVFIKGQPYHKLLITFQKEGGGKDFEDEYVYWIHTQNNTVDYLAYNYRVEGGGARFREAYNPRTIGGIRFADYINYKPLTKTLEVVTFDRLFEQDSLKELSRIISENIKVITAD